MDDLLKQELTCIHQPSEAILSLVSLSTHASPSLILPSVPDLSGLNICVAMAFICKHMKHHVSREVSSRVTMRGEGGVTGEGRLVGECRFNSWGKCTMAFTNMYSH